MQVDGTTTWVFAGMVPDDNKKALAVLKEEAHGKTVWERFNKTDVLVIDEISMVENFHLERISQRLKAARNDERAFGGLQVIVTGDFCQLSPIQPFGNCLHCGIDNPAKGRGSGFTCPRPGCGGSWADEEKWAFQSTAWKEAHFECVNLKEIHRQSNREFIKILQKIRLSKVLMPEEITLLMNHPSNVDNATKLLARRDGVAEINRKALNTLPSETHSYQCIDNFRWMRDKNTSLLNKNKCLNSLKEHRYDDILNLKKDALVVLLVNLDLEAGLCNGSQGIIIGYKPHDQANIPKPSGGEHASHKAADIASFIEQKFYQTTSLEQMAWPIVRFHNGVVRTIYPNCSISALGNDKPYSLLSRTQIPLAPAWAMTIHKSQSLTMDRVVVDLTNKVFAEGQLYVALSRARGLDGLRVEGTRRSLERAVNQFIGGNNEVLKFYRGCFPGDFEVDDDDNLKLTSRDSKVETKGTLLAFFKPQK